MLVVHWKMYIFDIETMKLLIVQWFCIYFVHSDTPSGAAGWAWLGCLSWLGPSERKWWNSQGNIHILKFGNLESV